jgi:hypothetical protein
MRECAYPEVEQYAEMQFSGVLELWLEVLFNTGSP